MYGRTGSLIAAANQGEALGELLLRAADIVTNLEGSIHYVVGVSADTVFVTEVWQSEAHHAASLKHPEVRKLIGEASPLIAGFGESSTYSVLGGLGV